MSKSSSKPVYVYDEGLSRATDCIPHLKGRGDMVHELIKAYGLLDLLDVRTSTPSTTEDILSFHSTAYVEFLEQAEESETGNTNGDNGNEEEEFGLGYDCPTFPGMIEFAKTITGGTLTAVKAVMEDESKVAFNWHGGWHHAQRDEASGFCYVNDIVIGIQYLLKKFKTVLYVDIDSHHGDGVENAFSYTNRVMTLSLHHHESGYFPGTGSLNDVGFGKGKYYSVNVPLGSGIVDDDYAYIFDNVFKEVLESFKCDVIVTQCGCDCLAGDPLGSFSLTENSLVHCVKKILAANLPTIFLGGGGYNLPNTAKGWTSIMFAVLNMEAPTDIPEHKYFLHYGPDFTLEVSPGRRRNENSMSKMNSLITSIKDNLHKIKGP